MRKLEKIPQRQCQKLVDREWQNVIILDGCRYDLYKEYYPESEKRYTVGSNSKEFISRNFSNIDLKDTVCVTGNPFYTKEWFKDLTGEPLDEKYHSVFDTIMTDWNAEEGTVMPESIVRDAKTSEKLFPEKRKIIHFMQPHFPFIGKNFENTGFPAVAENEDFGVKNTWNQVQKGEIQHENAVEGYRNNLEIVLNHVEELAECLSGRTVITADHGNLVGEKGIYGHPSNNQVKKLREVPWHIYE